MNANEWVAAFAGRLGVSPPDAAEVERVLALAATAAHQSERTAAPVACYLAGRAGLDPGRANELAADLGGGSEP